MESISKFIDKLADIIDKPPYLVFVFIGAVLVFTSMITQEGFKQTWIFFIYSAVGMVWRYIDKDVRKHVLSEKYKIASIVIYHIGNLVLLFFLLSYLDLF